MMGRVTAAYSCGVSTTKASCDSEYLAMCFGVAGKTESMLKDASSAGATASNLQYMSLCIKGGYKRGGGGRGGGEERGDLIGWRPVVGTMYLPIHQSILQAVYNLLCYRCSGVAHSPAG